MREKEKGGKREKEEARRRGAAKQWVSRRPERRHRRRGDQDRRTTDSLVKAFRRQSNVLRRHGDSDLAVELDFKAEVSATELLLVNVGAVWFKGSHLDFIFFYEGGPACDKLMVETQETEHISKLEYEIPCSDQGADAAYRQMISEEMIGRELNLWDVVKLLLL
ncbi:hypothetical protein F0562_025590 [Nyssa sinensis]|uniref:Uncharacterized protein n=1 Tax=Nyssa sinensis TaxID=561372 RepID=A0A5J5B8I5_9ASTE|nr:hypothetical protein F0562_025590 [Nyssa sinensis]